MNTSINNLNQYADHLPEFLGLQTPSTAKDSPSIFEFERFRELEFDWFSNSDLSGNDELDKIDNIKNYFVRFWKQYTAIDKAAFEDNAVFENLKTEKVWAYKDVYYEGKNPFNQVFCLIHKPSDRLYAFADKNNVLLTKTSLGLDSNDTNEEAWNKIYDQGGTDLVIVYGKVDEDKYDSSFRYVSRESIFFKEEYERLRAQWDFVNKFNSHSDKFVGDAMKDPGQFKKYWDDEEELDKLAGTYSNFKAKTFKIDQKLRQLAEKVRDYGYFLALKDESISKTPPVSVKKGQIYQTKQEVYTKKDVHRRRVRKKVGKNRYRYEWQYYPVYTKVNYVNYIPVNLDQDPIINEADKLELDGYEVYHATSTNQGFVVESGVLLRDILDRCELDESFRRKCAVIIPEYDHILSNKTYNVGAFVFKHPLPGIVPTTYPSIGLREELSYRLAWKGMEIGQLVSSINLAPGETRNITVSTKFKQTTSQTASFRSINDVNTTESFDLATEFQREASRELTRISTFEAEAGGSGGIGPFKLKASAGGSRKTNLKQFSKQMARVAKKTAQSINRRLSQEITSTSSLSTEISQEANKAITITNVNQGQTLNLMFYQVNNIYDSTLFMTELEIMVGSTKELIAGSGIYETKSFRLHELDSVYEELDPKLLPNQAYQDPEDYWEALEQLFIDTLSNEYDVKSKAPESAKVMRFTYSEGAAKVARQIAGKNKKLTTEMAQPDKQWLASSRHSNSLLDVDDVQSLDKCDKFKLLRIGLTNAEVLEIPMDAQNVTITSGGLYVDSLMGIMPGTELYTEEMRALEAEKVAMSNDKISAENALVRAKTRLLSGADTNFISETWTYPMSKDTYRLQMQLFRAVSDDNWRLFFNSMEVVNPAITLQGGNKVMIISLPGQPPADIDKVDIKLIHTTTGEILMRL